MFVFGPFKKGISSFLGTNSLTKFTLYATGSEFFVTTQQVVLVTNWGGNGSYNLIRTSPPLSNWVLIAINTLLSPKLR